ncbi:hypothetical protein ACFSVJ_06475 [Prauserella oleivorans]
MEHRRGHALRDGARRPATGQRGRLADLQPADLRDGPGPHVAGAVRPARYDDAAPPQRTPHRLPGGAARRAHAGAAAQPPHPRDPARRGAQLSLRIERGSAAELARRLRHEHGVITDAREPDVLRLAPVPLYSTYHDCWRAADALSEEVS